MDITHREPVACDRLTVGDDVDVLAAGLPLGKRAPRARNLAQESIERHPDLLDLAEILAKDLDADRRPDPRREHVDPRADRRCDRDLVARHLQRDVQVARQLIEGPAAPLGPQPPQQRRRPRRSLPGVPSKRLADRPLRAGPQHDDRLDHVELRGIGGGLRSSDLAVHRDHLLEAHDDLMLDRHGTPGFLDGDAR